MRSPRKGQNPFFSVFYKLDIHPELIRKIEAVLRNSPTVNPYNLPFYPPQSVPCVPPLCRNKKRIAGTEYACFSTTQIRRIVNCYNATQEFLHSSKGQKLLDERNKLPISSLAPEILSTIQSHTVRNDSFFSIGNYCKWKYWMWKEYPNSSVYLGFLLGTDGRSSFCTSSPYYCHRSTRLPVSSIIASAHSRNYTKRSCSCRTWRKLRQYRWLPYPI